MTIAHIRRRLLGALLALMVIAGPVAAQTLPGTASGTDSAISADEAVSRLLAVIEDDAARAALVDRLQAAATAVAEDGTAAATPNVAQRLAEGVVEVTTDTLDQVTRALRDLVRLATLPDSIATQGRAALPYLTDLILVAVAAFAVAFLGKRLVERLARRWRPTPATGLARRARLAVALLAARLVSIALAWAAGYALAVFVLSDGAPRPAQILFLNAFAATAAFRALLRTVVTPEADDEPALSAAAPGAQAVIYRRLGALAGVVLYGFLFVLPAAQAVLGFAAVRPIRTLIATLAAVLALVAVRRIVRALDASRGHRAGAGTADDTGAAMARGAQSVWRAIWPPLVVVYVLFSWFIAVTRPNLIDQIVLGGTAYTAVAVLMLLAALRLVDAAGTLHAPLPGWVVGLLPRLAPRANTITTVLGWILAALLGLGALGLMLHGWGAVNMSALLADADTQAVLWRIASAVLIALSAAILWALVASWIDERLTDGQGPEVSARSRTLLSLFRNAFTVAIGVLATMVALSQLGIDIAPLLAGAGVIGLAIGFGAQKLVQDIITGVFIQLENAINEGDVVSVAGITGGVEKVTIRSVRLRTLDGAAHIVPFSSVDTVSNLTRDFAYHVAEIGAAYKEKVPDVKAAMEEAFDRLKAEGFAPDILEPLEMHGVTLLGDSAVTVRARIKTKPGKQFALGRRYTELVKEVMDERGLEIPFPHRQLMLPEGLLRLQMLKEDSRPANDGEAAKSRAS